MIPKRRILVEPPGTAPGSDPLITSAFMSIVPKDTPNLGLAGARCKGLKSGARSRMDCVWQVYGTCTYTCQTGMMAYV